MRTNSRLKTAVFSLLPLLVLLAVAEIGARVAERYWPILPADADLGFSETSRLFVHADPQRMVTNPNKRGNFRESSFVVPKPPGTYRIFVLGESSVNYLDAELKQMARDLAGQLKTKGTLIEVINAGGLSYGSQRLRIIARELSGYEPDLAIVYIGNNEFEELEQLQLLTPGLSTTQELFDHLAVFRFLRDRLARAWITKLQRKHDEEFLSRSPDPEFIYKMHFRVMFTKAGILKRIRLFRENLGAIVDSFKKSGARVLLGTVPSNLLYPQFSFPADKQAYRAVLGLYLSGKYPEATMLGQHLLSEMSHHQATIYENEVIRETAMNSRVPIFDMVRAIEDAEPHGFPGETLFIDHCHLSPVGQIVWRKTVERMIIEKGYLP